MTAVAQLPDPGTGVLDRIGRAREAITEASAIALGLMSEEQLGAAVSALAGLQSQAEALKLTLGREAERRDVVRRGADTGVDAWLAKLTGERREALRGGLLLARRLEDAYPATLRALARGDIRVEQARVIVNGLDVSIDDATEQQRADAEELLLGKASGVATSTGTPVALAQLRRAARRAYASIDAELSKRHLQRSVRATSQRGASDTWLVVYDNGDGTYSGRFSLPEAHGQMLRTVLESLSAPRRYGRDRTGAEVTDDVAGSDGSGLGWADKLGLAFCELIEHLPTDRLPKSAISMLVHLDLDTLVGELSSAGIGVMTTGADVTAGDVRRWACEASIIPAILGGGSVPLDLGRTRRVHSDKQRQALSVIHDSCAIAGCDRPFAWCEIHHPKPWSAGGRTDLRNALPLCWHHHRAAHDPHYTMTKHSETEWSLRWSRRRC